jgi:N utilization substance protein B
MRESADRPSTYSRPGLTLYTESKSRTTNDRRPTTPMGTRRKSRELVLQMLFQADMGKQTQELVRKTFWAERTNVEEDVRGFADDLFRVASDRLTEIDGLIGKHTQHWRMDRMATVDRNVLRGAVAEFLGFPATPRAVVINEALEIARKFSTPESVQFINGVLDSVGKEVGTQ